uniref:C2 domain-containing protein n=1 Tax=Macrostomum lignano TaxID=282301 RepID=A0A1I8GKL6_9PLAT
LGHGLLRDLQQQSGRWRRRRRQRGGLGVSSQPELFLGLAYSATTGQLMAEVIKGSAFRLAGSSRAPDTFVKLTVQSAEGRSLFKSRTPTFTCNPNPMWKENFVYPINKSQLAGITLKVGVWAKKAMKRRHLIGCFALGRGGLGEEEKSHWQDMTEARGEQICRWHRLVAEGQKQLERRSLAGNICNWAYFSVNINAMISFRITFLYWC